VGAREIVTCAHVANDALGQVGDPLGAEVTLDFPLVSPGLHLPARVVMCEPSRADDTSDIAGLLLANPPPAGATPAPLVTVGDVWGHSFRAFGFPELHDDGVWATGLMRARQGTGWVQLEDVTGTAFRVEPGFSGMPVWDDERGGVVGIIVAAESSSTVRAAYVIPTDTLVAAWPVLKAKALPPCPYRGLLAFGENDKALFFGREELTGRLVSQLSRRPLVAVIGPSGSGKSSLVFAGAVPRLRDAGWVIADLRPAIGTSPLTALGGSLLPLLEPGMTEAERLLEVGNLEEALDQRGLAEVADRVLRRQGAQRLLLVVDQFEELYAQDPAVVQQFVDVLLRGVAAQRERPVPSLTVVLTLRADFLSQALEYAGLAEALRDSVLIGRMTRAQLRCAIEGPLPANVSFESGLVDRILNDVGEEAGNLPLLEFALTLLWDRQRARSLTHVEYTRLGGVDGALARYAEEVYTTDLDTSAQEAAARLFVQLVRPGEATEPTRRLPGNPPMSTEGSRGTRNSESAYSSWRSNQWTISAG